MKKDKHNFTPLFRKYAPRDSSEVIGQDKAIGQLKAFLKDYKKQRKKALLAVGPTGTGKTAAAYAVAKELDMEIIEVNASDFRNEEGINSILGAAIGQQSLFAKSKMVLVDEVDGISGKEDRGGLNALMKLIEKTTFPIIITGNDLQDYKYNKLKSQCISAEFNALQASDIEKILERINSSEKLGFGKEIIKGIARISVGDARAAINDLQTLSGFTAEKADIEMLGDRNRQESIINALMKILKSTDAFVAKGAFDNVDMDIDECILWLDENLPKEYSEAADLENAYDAMSRADVFRGRIRRWQHWRFLVYINDILTAGIAISKKQKYAKFVPYTPTRKLLKIWMLNQKNAMKKKIAQKLAPKLHTSLRLTTKETMPYVRYMFKKDKNFRENFSAYLELEKEEIEWLKK